MINNKHIVKVILIYSAVILAGVLIGMSIKIYWANKINNHILMSTSSVSSPVTLNIATQNTIPLENRLIDGVINQIINTDNVLEFNVLVNVQKFLPNAPSSTAFKIIDITPKTQFILHDLALKNDSNINSSDFKVGDQVAIWIIENNQDFYNLNHFTADKVIKFK